MRILSVIAVIGALFWAYSAGLIPGMSSEQNGAFAEDGSPTIMLFTTPQCDTLCDQIAGELHKRRAKFKKVVVTTHDPDEENTKLWKRLGGGNFPFLAAGAASSAVSNGPEVSSLLAATFGERYMRRDEKRLYKKHFNQYDEPQVTIYGADWCPYCAKLTKALREADIDYVEIDVPKHRNKTVISDTLDIRGYPTTWVGYNRVNGSDISAVKRTLKVATNKQQ